jgi:hypothetical protein
MSALPTLGGNNGFATGANNRGEVVGWAENTCHDPLCVPPQVLQFRPVIYGPRENQIREFPLIAGDTSGAATAINDHDSNGVVSAKFTPVESNCEGILEINNQERFWTNFRLQIIGTPMLTPLGGDANLYVKFGLLPPKNLLPLTLTSPVAFKVRFNRPGESIIVRVDPTAETSPSAGYMNLTQAILNVVPGSGFIQVGIDGFAKIKAAFDQMPHLQNAVTALFNEPPDTKTFFREFKRIDFDEAVTLVTLIRDLGGSIAREGFKGLLKAPGRILNSVATIFDEIRATFFAFPSGSVALESK